MPPRPPELPDKFKDLQHRQIERAAAYMMIAALVGLFVFLFVSQQWGEAGRNVILWIVVLVVFVTGVIAARG